eukprot:scaffold53653_cov70-Phaeocystis_antarctica.AAC.4
MRVSPVTTLTHLTHNSLRRLANYNTLYTLVFNCHTLPFCVYPYRPIPHENVLSVSGNSTQQNAANDSTRRLAVRYSHTPRLPSGALVQPAYSTGRLGPTGAVEEVGEAEHLCGKQGRPARAQLPIGRGWPRLEITLILIWRWRSISKAGW